MWHKCKIKIKCIKIISHNVISSLVIINVINVNVICHYKFVIQLIHYYNVYAVRLSLSLYYCIIGHVLSLSLSLSHVLSSSYHPHSLPSSIDIGATIDSSKLATSYRHLSRHTDQVIRSSSSSSTSSDVIRQCHQCPVIRSSDVIIYHLISLYRIWVIVIPYNVNVNVNVGQCQCQCQCQCHESSSSLSSSLVTVIIVIIVIVIIHTTCHDIVIINVPLMS